MKANADAEADTDAEADAEVDADADKLGGIKINTGQNRNICPRSMFKDVILDDRQ